MASAKSEALNFSSSSCEWPNSIILTRGAAAADAKNLKLSREDIPPMGTFRFAPGLNWAGSDFLIDMGAQPLRWAWAFRCDLRQILKDTDFASPT